MLFWLESLSILLQIYTFACNFASRKRGGGCFYWDIYGTMMHHGRQFTVICNYGRWFTVICNYGRWFTVICNYGRWFTVICNYGRWFTVICNYGRQFTVICNYGKQFTVICNYGRQFTVIYIEVVYLFTGCWSQGIAYHNSSCLSGSAIYLNSLQFSSNDRFAKVHNIILVSVVGIVQSVNAKSNFIPRHKLRADTKAVVRQAVGISICSHCTGFRLRSQRECEWWWLLIYWYGLSGTLATVYLVRWLQLHILLYEIRIQEE